MWSSRGGDEMQRYLEEFEKERVVRRLRIYRWVVVATGIFLLFRFTQLQIFQGGKWRMVATENQFRKVRLFANRGQFLDRKGRILAGNRPGFNLAVIPADINIRTIDQLTAILDMPAENFRKKIKENLSGARFLPMTIKQNLSWEELSRLEEHGRELSGIDIEYRPLRSYPGLEIGCHVLGYIGEISSAELLQLKYADYQQGDFIGKAGLEKIFEKYLHGTPGYRFKIVDAQGRERPPDIIPGVSLKPQAPTPGRDVTLTIDLDLQTLAQSLLVGKAGAIVMISVKDGEILAMASSPTFNPEVFSNPFHPEEWKKLETDPAHPLYNRAIQGVYSPGSVFKLVLALAGLEEKTIDPVQKLRCNGIYYFGGLPFKCWKKLGHGTIALQDAIIQSCDIYFYQRGVQLGIDRIAYYANLLGLGLRTGIDLPSENSGLIPTSSWRENVRKEKWHPGDTVSASIGQGFILVTPLQAAMLAMAIANQGELYKPVILRSISGVSETELQEFRPRLMQKVNFSPETWKLVREAMTGVVNDPHGTAYWGARSSKVRLAGKTGTAQVVKSKKFEGVAEALIPMEFRDHAWFIAYAPAENPRVAVSVLVEHGGHGASAAAPLARTMVEKFLELYPEANDDE